MVQIVVCLPIYIQVTGNYLIIPYNQNYLLNVFDKLVGLLRAPGTQLQGLLGTPPIVQTDVSVLWTCPIQ